MPPLAVLVAGASGACIVYDSSLLTTTGAGAAGGAGSTGQPSAIEPLPETGPPADARDAPPARAPEAAPRDAGPWLDMIDDLEHTGKAIPTVGSRTGHWVIVGTRTTGGKHNPEPITTSPTTPPRAGSTLAMHYFGTGEDQAGIGVGFNDFLPTPTPVNASGDTGVTFWARAGDTNDPLVSWYLLLGDRTTTPAGGLCGVGGAGACFDDFGYALDLTSDWKKYTVPFADLVPGQLGFGAHGPALDATTLFSVAFKTAGTPADTFDIWIDDLALLCRSSDCRPIELPDGAPYPSDASP
jgi:hypothetical protein